MILDLSVLPSMGRSKLIRLFPRKEKDSSSISVSWEADICTEVISIEEANVLNKFVKGSSSVYLVGQEGGKSEIKDETNYEVICISIFNREKEKVVSGHAELIRTIVRSKGLSCVAIMKFIIHDVIPANAANLSICLDEDIYVYISSPNSSKVSSFKEANYKSNLLRLGNIVYFDNGNSVSPHIISEFKDGKITVLGSENMSIVEFQDINNSYIKEECYIQYNCKPREFIEELINEFKNKNIQCVNPISAIMDYIGNKFVLGERPCGPAWAIKKEEIKNIIKLSTK